MIHETAIVSSSARLADDVGVGPYAVSEGDVEIGEGTTIGPHTVIRGGTRIGSNNQIYQFASIGEAPQDKKYGDRRWQHHTRVLYHQPGHGAATGPDPNRQ